MLGGGQEMLIPEGNTMAEVVIDSALPHTYNL